MSSLHWLTRKQIKEHDTPAWVAQMRKKNKVKAQL